MVIRGLLTLMVYDLATWSPLPLGGGGHGHITATAATLTCHTPDGPSSHNLLEHTTLDPQWHAALLAALHQQPQEQP